MWRFVATTLLLLLVVPFLWVRLARPDRTEQVSALAPGVTYERIIREEPELVLHVVQIDLTTPGLEFLVTPGMADGRFPPQTTGRFLRAYDLQLAVNGSFYRDTGESDHLQPLGTVIANGIPFTAARADWPALCIPHATAVHFAPDGNCAAGTQQALAGNVMLVENDRPLNPRTTDFPGRSNSFRPQPRTAVALDETGRTMWLVVADGRQPNYSIGMALDEFAQFVAGLGAHQALNLDGGGSSTLVADNWIGSRTLNSPVHNGIPTRQRPIPTHLGIAIRQ